MGNRQHKIYENIYYESPNRKRECSNCNFLFFSFMTLERGQFKMQLLKLAKDAIAILLGLLNTTAICRLAMGNRQHQIYENINYESLQISFSFLLPL
jgi:hypothetical protein